MESIKIEKRMEIYPTAPVPVVIRMTFIEASVSNFDIILNLSVPLTLPSIRTYFMQLDLRRCSARSSVVFQQEKTMLRVETKHLFWEFIQNYLTSSPLSLLSSSSQVRLAWWSGQSQ